MVSRVAIARPSVQPAPAMKSSKPLLRTLSGTVRKYDEAGLEMSITPLSPSKRTRVSFNPTVEQKLLVEWSGRSVESVKKEIKRALEAHARNESEGYAALKEVFATRKEENNDVEENPLDKDKEMKTYLVALTSCVSILNKNYIGLVNTILACEWMGRKESFVKAYAHFLGNLASAQGAYVEPILRMLVGLFYGEVKSSSGRLPGLPTASRTVLTSRIHDVLKYLLGIVPSAAANILLPILVAKFPFADETKKLHISYIENLISLLKYAPALKPDIFALITDRLVKIDVQMQLDLDDVDDDVASAVVQALSLTPSGRENDEDAEEDSNESDADSVASEESLAADAKRIQEIQDNVEKMDAILDRLFELYDPYFADPTSATALTMFEILLAHFTNIVLPTYHSRHTQFLLFHFSQKSEDLIDQFAGTCVQLAFAPSRPAVFRQSAAAYLASFVARGAHVPAHVVRTVFELIGNHLDEIRMDSEADCRGPNLKRYTTFYAMTQALVYIFCFRWRDLVESAEILEDEDPAAFVGHDLEWVPGVKETISRTIYSRFNPLKICCPSIVTEFAKIARHLRFMYIYPLLESNKRIRLSQFASGQGAEANRNSGNSRNDDTWYQLDAYFPFDPYQLPISKRWVEDDYVQWRGIPGLDQEENLDDDEESNDNDELKEDAGTATEDDE